MNKCFVIFKLQSITENLVSERLTLETQFIRYSFLIAVSCVSLDITKDYSQSGEFQLHNLDYLRYTLKMNKLVLL